MANTREDFLKPIPLKTIEVETAELGIVRLQQLSGSQVTALHNWRRPNGELDPSRNWLYKLVTLSVVNANGERLLTDDDVDLIGSYPPSLSNLLAVEAAKLNGFVDDEDSNEAPEDLLGK